MLRGRSTVVTLSLLGEDGHRSQTSSQRRVAGSDADVLVGSFISLADEISSNDAYPGAGNRRRLRQRRRHAGEQGGRSTTMQSAVVVTGALKSQDKTVADCAVADLDSVSFSVFSPFVPHFPFLFLLFHPTSPSLSAFPLIPPLYVKLSFAF